MRVPRRLRVDSERPPGEDPGAPRSPIGPCGAIGPPQPYDLAHGAASPRPSAVTEARASRLKPSARRVPGLLAAGVLLAGCTLAQASASDRILPRTRYVPTDYPTIQTAIDAAANGDTVLVLPGTYPERITFRGKSLVLESTDGPEATTIDAEQLGRVVLFEGGEDTTTVLRGFAIIHGMNESLGTAVLIEDGAFPLICSNVITLNGNGVSARILQYLGRSDGNLPSTLCHNTIHDNDASIAVVLMGARRDVYCLDNRIQDNRGNAGIRISADGRGVIRGNLVRNQDGGPHNGFGIYSESPGVVIEGNLICGSSRAGILQVFHSARVEGNILCHNGGGVTFSDSPTPTLLNNTIVNNIGAGVYAWHSTVTAQNNLVAWNADGIRMEPREAEFILDRNNVYQNSSNDYLGLAPGSKDLSLPPGFRDLPGHDLRLAVTSPLLDQGAEHPQRDFKGPRPDIGAHEYAYPDATALTVQLDIQPRRVQRGDEIVVQVDISNNGIPADTVDVWIEATGSHQHRILEEWADLVLEGGHNLRVTRTVTVPPRAFVGPVTIKARVGHIGEAAEASDVVDARIMP